MQKSIKYLVLPLFVLLAISCGNGNHADHNHHEDGIGVHLHDGVRWQANPETTEGINNITNLVNTFTGDNYAELKNNLETEFGLIFERCTMKGEAHDQLHNYLLPLRDLIGELEGNNPSSAIALLKQHLVEYSNYFE